MSKSSLHTIAKQMVAKGKGILAADESDKTANKRLASAGAPETEEMRRKYREVFLSTDEIGTYLSGVILFDTTIREKADSGERFVKVLEEHGVLPGIKVDMSTVPFTNFPGELLTEGLDGLMERFNEYYKMGARFAKWRGVITIDEKMPSDECIESNAFLLARYAALSQEAGMVPIIEPEVLIDGDHTIERSEEITTHTLKVVFDFQKRHKVDLGGLILKSSMVISGKDCVVQANTEDIAERTVRCFQASVPNNVAGIVFLSGGQSADQATNNLNEISKRAESENAPWPITFSFARALQSEALEIWRGKDENIPAAREAFIRRLDLVCKAREGKLVS